MISEDLKQLLLDRDKNSNLNFKLLVEFLDNSEYEFIGASLRGIMGIATEGRAFFDIYWLGYEDNQLLYFVMLHEYCHILSIKKMGKDVMISKFALEDFDEFFEHIVDEEIKADRFAKFYFYLMNLEEYPRYRTQQLEDEYYKDKYSREIGELHTQIKTKEDYDKMINSFVVDWTSIDYEQPIWYKDVEVLTDGKVKSNFHRLSDGENIYYGTLESDEIIHEKSITHWRELKEE